MPTAINKETGEILTLSADGAWAPAQRARNPQTGEELYLDGQEWKPTPYVAPASQKAKQAADESRGFLGRMTDKAQEGAMLGFRDEATAGVRSLTRTIGDILRGRPVDMGARYDEALAYERNRSKETDKQAPVLSTVAQILGGAAMLPAAPTGVVPPAGAGIQSLGSLSAKGAAMGGGTGAVAGFGSGEGGLGNRLEAAAEGGAAGAALGAATPYAIEGGRRLTDYVRGALGIGDQTGRAERLVARALQRDNLTMDDIATRRTEMQAQGINDPLMADLGGENVKRLTRAAGTVPGEGTRVVQDAVQGRSAAQAGEILGDIKTYLSPVDDFHGAMDAVSAIQKKTASPLYREAYDTHKFVWNDRIDDFLKDPIIKQGINKGLKVERLEALAEGRAMRPEDFGVTGFNEAGENIIGGKPTLRLLDAAKRGLDEILNDARSDITGKIKPSETNRAVEMVRKALVEEIDRVTAAQNGGRSVYAEARRAYAGPAAAKDALAFGRRDVLKMDPETIAKRIADMGESEREFTKAGVARALSDIVNGKADDLDVTKGMLRNPTVRARLRAVFGDDPGLDQFIRNIETRRGMAQTDAFISPRTGSQTQPRTADAAELLESPSVAGDAVPQLLSGNIRGAVAGAVRGQLPRLAEGAGSRTAAELARLLMGDPAQTATRLSDRALADAETRRRMAQILTQLAPAEGRQAGFIAGP